MLAEWGQFYASVSKPEVRVWISFVARYADVKCLRTLRSNAVRAWVD